MNKKFQRTMSLLVVLLIASAMLVGAVGCSNKDVEPTPEKTLSRIGITAFPKTTYMVDETFNPTGMVVTAYYSDQSKEAITDYQTIVDNPLKITTRSAIIMYKGKQATLPITVNMPMEEMLHIESDEHAVYTVEAENLDYSYCYNPYSDDHLVSTENVVTASGGKSIGSLAGEGNSFGFIVKSEYELTVNLVIRAAAVHEDRFCDTVMDVKVNGDVKKSNHTLTWGENNSFYNWENVTYSEVKLKTGENRVEIMINVEWYAPNIDCFYIVVAPDGHENLEPESAYATKLEIANGEHAVHKVEAEDLDLSTWEGAEVKDSSSASGNQYVDLPDTLDNYSSEHSHNVGFSIRSAVEAKIKISMSLSYTTTNPIVALDDIINIYWNGVKVKTDYEFKSKDGSVWELATVAGELDLIVGNNIITFETHEYWTPDVDYFNIVVAPNGDEGDDNQPTPDPDPDLEYAVKLELLNGATGDYTVEAEGLDLSTWEGAFVENVTTVGGLSGNGNFSGAPKLGFTVKSEVSGKVKISLKVAFGKDDANKNFDEMLKLTWNGETLQTNFAFDENSGWTTWETVTVTTELDLNEGYNTFVIQSNFQYWVPNLDCIIFEVNPQA